jgi:hypothetical protein
MNEEKMELDMIIELEREREEIKEEILRLGFNIMKGEREKKYILNDIVEILEMMERKKK